MIRKLLPIVLTLLPSLAAASSMLGPSQPVTICNPDASVCQDSVAGGGGGGTVDQGAAGASPWLAFITNFPAGFNVNNFPSTYTVVQSTGTNLHMVLDSGTLTANIGTTGGLALDATLSTNTTLMNAHFVSVETLLGTLGTQATLALIKAKTDNLDQSLSSIKTELDQKTEPANQQHTIIDSGAVTANGPADSVTTGTLTATAQSVCKATAGYQGVSITISGTWGGTIDMQESFDSGTTYVDVNFFNNSLAIFVAATGINGSFSIANLGGASNVCAYATSISSGTANISIRTTQGAFNQATSYGADNGFLPSTINFIGGSWDGSSTGKGVAVTNGSASNSWFGLVTKPVNIVTAPLFTTLSDGTAALGTAGNPIRVLSTATLALDATLTARFPTGASPADNESNTSTSLSRIGTYNFVYDGSTWDRWTGAVTNTNLDVALSTRLKPADTLTGVTTVTSLTQMNGAAISMNTGVRDAGTQRVTIATNDLVPVSGTVTVTPPTLTKGTQGATGFSTQDLKDAGRNNTNFFTVLPIITTNAEALLSLTGFKSDAAVTTTTTPAVVTSGKKYRVTNIAVTYVATATAGSTRLSLRKKVAGTVAVTDPVVWMAVIGGPAVVAGDTEVMSYPVDIEINAGDGIGVSQLGLSATQVAAATGYGAITITGYEY